MRHKMHGLVLRLHGMEKVIVAFSGGTDSTFLTAVAHAVLGRRALAVTIDSPLLPRAALAQATLLARRYGWRWRALRLPLLHNKKISANATQRCYFCKKTIFRALRALARRHAISSILDGSNLDDTRDYRPGRRAAAECDIISPLADARFTKRDIRRASAILGLPTADKPAEACLASRIPYGTPLTAAELRKIEKAEAALRQRGFAQVRVRSHGQIARIELPARDVARAGRLRQKIVDDLRRIGYYYVALDLEGYRAGSLNAGIKYERPHGG